MFKKIILSILFLQSLSFLMAMEEQKSMDVYGTKSPDPSDLIQKQLLLAEALNQHVPGGRKDVEWGIMKPLIALSLTTKFSFPSVEFIANRLKGPGKKSKKFVIDGINFWLFCNGGTGVEKEELKLIQIRNVDVKENSFGTCATYSEAASDYSCLAYIEAKRDLLVKKGINRSEDYSFELTLSQTAKGSCSDNIYCNIGKGRFVDIYPEDVIFKIVRKI